MKLSELRPMNSTIKIRRKSWAERYFCYLSEGHNIMIRDAIADDWEYLEPKTVTMYCPIIKDDKGYRMACVWYDDKAKWNF